MYHLSCHCASSGRSIIRRRVANTIHVKSERIFFDSVAATPGTADVHAPAPARERLFLISPEPDQQDEQIHDGEMVYADAARALVMDAPDLIRPPLLPGSPSAGSSLILHLWRCRAQRRWTTMPISAALDYSRVLHVRNAEETTGRHGARPGVRTIRLSRSPHSFHILANQAGSCQQPADDRRAGVSGQGHVLLLRRLAHWVLPRLTVAAAQGVKLTPIKGPELAAALASERRRAAGDGCRLDMGKRGLLDLRQEQQRGLPYAQSAFMLAAASSQ